MKKDLLVSFYAQGLRLEKLINEAGKMGIKMKKVRREKDRRMLIYCSPSEYRAFAELAREKGYSVTRPRPVGPFLLFTRLYQRKGIWIGALICAAILLFSTRFIWGIRIENAGPYEGEVRTFLEEMNIYPGMLRNRLHLGELREKLEWRLPRVQWVRADMSGMFLHLRLEEGTPPPEIQDRGSAGDVVAAEDGILTRLTVYAGTPVCKIGDLVHKGQVLIKGEEKRGAETLVSVKARGEAMARVWITCSAKSSLNVFATLPTGRISKRNVLVTPFFTFSLTPEPEFLTWDEEREETMLGGAFFPLILRRETRMEAAVEIGQRDMQEARREAAEMALFQLKKEEIHDDFIDKWVDYSMIEGDIIVATATGEMIRDIARYQKNP